MSENKNPEVIGIDIGNGPDQTGYQYPHLQTVEHEDTPIPENTGNNDNVQQIPFHVKPQAPEESPNEEGQKELIDDPENPLNDINERQLQQMIKTTMEMVQIMENAWTTSKREFSVTDAHMMELFQYNEQHKTQMPEYITDEEKDKWDHFNGIDTITEDDIIKIFGEEHPVIGLTHDITKDRVKDLVEDYFNWMVALREYKQIYTGYIRLGELREEKNIEILRKRAEAEEDPEQKQKMLDAIEMYYNRKYLKFLAEPLSEEDRDRVVHAFHTEKTISYWVKRSQDKLKQLKMPGKFILEISQFEKRFLPEKYHKQSNILLLYFMMTIIYCRCSDRKDPGRNKSVAMITTLDQFVQNILEDDKREMVLNNIMAFEDQFMDLIPEQPQNDETSES